MPGCRARWIAAAPCVPGGRRVFIGYYRLYQNSTVRARGMAGATATFRDLGRQVTAADGAVGLRFEDRDLRSRSRAAVTASRHSRRRFARSALPGVTAAKPYFSRTWSTAAERSRSRRRWRRLEQVGLRRDAAGWSPRRR